MKLLKPVRGTQDVLAKESASYRSVEKIAYDITRRYGFEEIITPVFESTDVFARTLGDTSDIVTKEMYTFEDKGGESITLRPEGTAGIARAFISNGLQQNLPLKFFYKGPMFRYERPQKGRRRQFNQVGIEILGVSEPQADVEAISLAATFLEAVGINDKITLELNSLGDDESRDTYRQKLLSYMNDRRGELSPNSINRLKVNPLRILDSKEPQDQEIIQAAPKLHDSLNKKSKEFFSELCGSLTRLGIQYVHKPNLVRGLDYYSHTAFEFTTKELGSQSAILAGGRYDRLIGQMGGPKTAGIGWAAGIERLALLANVEEKIDRPISVIPSTKEVEIEAMILSEKLRKKGYTINLDYSGNLKKRMKRANNKNSILSIIMDDDTLTKKLIKIKNMDSGNQEELPMKSLESRLRKYKR